MEAIIFELDKAMEIILIASLFIALSIVIESLGAWLRFIGSVGSEAALGYSSHVRLATLGRFFILLSAPLLGYLIDSGVNSTSIATIGFLAFLLVFLCLLLSITKNLTPFFSGIYNFLNKKSDIKLEGMVFDNLKLNKKLAFYSFFSFGLTASGILVVNYLATIFTEQRAMIVQMAAFVTTLGTLIHAFMVDPVLARLCDSDEKLAYSSVRSFIVGRVFSSLFLILLFSILVFYEQA